MTKQQVREFLESKGWLEGRAGCFKKTRDDVRYKMGKLVLRREGRTTGGQWVRLASAYYKDLELTAEGKLKGMAR